MGICKHCGKEITLINNEPNCPSCSMPPYNCWNCKEEITGETKECPACHFFYCPDCGICSSECQISEIIKETKAPRELILKIYETINKPPRQKCPRGVPISYAKQKLRNFALRLKKLLVKDDLDFNGFKEKLDEIDKFPIGKTWTINQIKDAGTYGFEFREASNFSVCSGMATKQFIQIEKEKVNKSGKIIKQKFKFEQFERAKYQPCPYSNWEKLIVDGKKSHCEFCSLKRNKFIKNKEVDNNGVFRNS